MRQANFEKFSKIIGRGGPGPEGYNFTFTYNPPLSSSAPPVSTSPQGDTQVASLIDLIGKVQTVIDVGAGAYNGAVTVLSNTDAGQHATDTLTGSYAKPGEDGVSQSMEQTRHEQYTGPVGPTSDSDESSNSNSASESGGGGGAG